MLKPLFTIITATYNASATLGATLQSIYSQCFANFEHIVMDGASNDDTIKMAQTVADERMAIVSESDHGIYHAMNKALRMAKGDYLIFLNAGDTFADENTLHLIHDTIVEQNFPDVVYGQTTIVDTYRQILGPRHLTAPKDLTWQSFANGMLVCHQAFIPRREIAVEYDEQYHLSADFDWCIRTLQHATCAVLINKPIIHYLSEGLSTLHHRKSLIERYKIMCLHYGTTSTILKHIFFIMRHAIRRLKGAPNRQ